MSDDSVSDIDSNVDSSGLLSDFYFSDVSDDSSELGRRKMNRTNGQDSKMHLLDDDVLGLVFSYLMGNHILTILKSRKLKRVNKKFRQIFDDHVNNSPLSLDLNLFEQDQCWIDKLHKLCNWITKYERKVGVLKAYIGYNEVQDFVELLRKINVVDLKSLSLVIEEENHRIATEYVYSLFTNCRELRRLELSENTASSAYQMLFSNHLSNLEFISLSMCIPGTIPRGSPALVQEIQSLPSLRHLRIFDGFSARDMILTSASLTVLNLGRFYVSADLSTLRFDCPTLKVFIADSEKFSVVCDPLVRIGADEMEPNIKDIVRTETKWLNAYQDSCEFYTNPNHIEIVWANVPNDCLFVLI